MQLRQKHQFTTIRTEGSILPADLLQRINEREAGLAGLKPEDYHLPGNLKLNEAINQSWNRLLGAWTAFRSALVKLQDTDPATTLTREKWLLPVFNELGYGRLLTARAVELEGRSYPVSHGWQHTPLHLVGAGVDLDKRTAGVAGAARMSPHSLVQELLNRSEAHLWGMVSNGLRLRILRDNVSLTRQAYVEFDLEAMMNGELYADFALFWLLCHESRVHAEKPQDCWLEKWSKTAQDQGTRALEQLRRGVEEAIEALGRGFLAHASNHALVTRLRTGALSTQDYYRQLLRLVYRLLFLFVAEDRDLLLRPEADTQARERYERFYSLSRLRLLAERRVGTRHADLYHGLRLVMEKLGSDVGCPELALPALGSFLFSREASPDLEACDIANAHLLDAVRALAFINDRHGRRLVDYKNLRSEELGSVYEALLELLPDVHIEARQFELKTVSGSERKSTGSYYTPESLVQCLLDSALEPVVAETLKQPDAAQAILRLKVCDPACGSGHFLIAAAHRLAKHLASVRTGDDEPAPEAVWKKIRDRNHPYPITEELFRKIERNPFHVVNTWHEQEIRSLAEQYQFFHWHLAFPDVFRVPVGDEEPENEGAEWNGGLDVVLNNPPWEKLQTEELPFFAARRPEIAMLAGAKRKEAIESLCETAPDLVLAWRDQKRLDAAAIAFVRNSSTYLLTGVGKFNSFALFAELNARVVAPAGRVGCIVPSGIATDDTTKLFFQKITRSKLLVSLFDFENRYAIFPSVHRSYRFCLLTLTGTNRPAKSGGEFVFFAHTVEDLYEVSRHFTLSADEIELLNPNTLTCPTFRLKRDAEINKNVYQRVPSFIIEREPSSDRHLNHHAGSLSLEHNLWKADLKRMVNMADDSSLFKTASQLVAHGYSRDKERNFTSGSELYLRLYESKMFAQFDHRFGTFEGITADQIEAGNCRELEPAERQEPQVLATPRYWMPIDAVEEKMRAIALDRKWLMAYRDITNATNERTVLCSFIPTNPVGHTAFLISSMIDTPHNACLLANLNSMVFDYLARQKLSGMHLSQFILKQLPVLPPSIYDEHCSWADGELSEWLAPRLLELTYTAYDLIGFATDCGYTGPPFLWDEERRFLLRCELDAAYCHLYGIGRDDVDYILETFPIVKRKDEQAHGEYRAKRVILDIYDTMQQAMETGTPYHTRLDPPPANGWTPPEVTLEVATGRQGNGVKEKQQRIH